MKRRSGFVISSIISISIIFCGFAFAQESKPIKLMAPQLGKGKTLMQSLKDRRSSREFSGKTLPLEVLSDLLWAACGINRTEIAHRTAPTAMNMQEIDVYAAFADGLYLYDVKENSLVPVVSTDIRELTGKQPFVKDAPLNLIFVADHAKMSKLSDENKDFYAATDTGFISQNVYLFCASAGLATVVRGSIDKPALAKAMKLRPDQKIIMAQTVGYPQ
jgi:SagB-type dehydrogenase family enzyme